MSSKILSRDELTNLAQRFAVEATVGVLIRDGAAENESIRKWVREVLADEPDPQRTAIIARTMHFAQRMTSGGGRETIGNFL